jgi:hypothetical protein
MIFSIDYKTEKLKPIVPSWTPSELKLEKYILPDKDSDEPNLLNQAVFRESLLLIRNQVHTKHKKRADILAIDRLGNGVIIELKKDLARMGVETQALQYLAAFSAHKGKGFISEFFNKYTGSLVDDLEGFGVPIEAVNQYSRIILIARSFDPSLFSMGRWLADNKVAFRCIEYFPFEINSEKFLSFSIAFDQSPPELFPLSFLPHTRDPQYFWHNIGSPENTMTMQAWWDYLVRKQEIRTSFGNQPGDEGERILREYREGDTVIAYASGCGAVGWGVVEKPNSYKLVPGRDKDDVLNGRMRHRLKVRWKSFIEDVNDALKPQMIKQLSGHPPMRTRVRIDDSVAIQLIERLDNVSDHLRGVKKGS